MWIWNDQSSFSSLYFLFCCCLWFLFFGFHLRLPGLAFVVGRRWDRSVLDTESPGVKTSERSIRVAVGSSGHALASAQITRYCIPLSSWRGPAGAWLIWLLAIYRNFVRSLNMFKLNLAVAAIAILHTNVLQISGIWDTFGGMGKGTGLSCGAFWSCRALPADDFPVVFLASFCLQKQKNIAGALAFWMANASELLNFIKQDRDLSRITVDAQDVLAHLVQMAFK